MRQLSMTEIAQIAGGAAQRPFLPNVAAEPLPITVLPPEEGAPRDDGAEPPAEERPEICLPFPGA